MLPKNLVSTFLSVLASQMPVRRAAPIVGRMDKTRLKAALVLVPRDGVVAEAAA